MRDLPYWRLAGAYFFYFAYLGAFAPYFSLYLNSIGVAAAGIGVIMSLPQLVRIVAPHLWGWLADRDDLDGATPRVQEPRGDSPVAPVVPRSTDDRDAAAVAAARDGEPVSLEIV